MFLSPSKTYKPATLLALIRFVPGSHGVVNGLKR